MSPSMPCTSVTCVTRRVPSLRRLICTMTSIAEAICSRIARSGRSMPAISTSVSRRAIASRGELACIVEIEPSWPVFIACSMSRLSRAAHLADDDAVGPHAQRVPHQVADRDLASALDVRRPRLQPHDVLLLQLQLDRILDRDDALVAGDERRQHVEQRRLAGAGTAGDEDVQLRPHRRIEHRRDLAGQRAEARSGRRPCTASRANLRIVSDEPFEGERRDDRVDARAVFEARIHQRRRLVDAAADPRDDALDHPPQLRLAGEAVRRLA